MSTQFLRLFCGFHGLWLVPNPFHMARYSSLLLWAMQWSMLSTSHHSLPLKSTCSGVGCCIPVIGPGLWFCKVETRDTVWKPFMWRVKVSLHVDVDNAGRFKMVLATGNLIFCLVLSLKYSCYSMKLGHPLPITVSGWIPCQTVVSLNPELLRAWGIW